MLREVRFSAGPVKRHFELNRELPLAATIQITAMEMVAH
jgi:hypothetical protein